MAVQVIEALREVLGAHSALTAIVPKTKIFRTLAPQEEAAPFLVLAVIDGRRPSTHRGSSGFCQPFVNVTAWASTPAKAEQICEHVFAALQGLKSTVAVEGGSIRFCGVLLQEGGGEDYDDERHLAMFEAPYLAQHQEVIPTP